MHGGFDMAQLIVTVASVLVLALLVKAGFERLRLPPSAGYLLVGFALASLHAAYPIFDEPSLAVVDFLGKVGVIALLFAVGLKSNLRSLLGQLRRASPVWLVSVIVSAGAGYAASAYLLGFGAVPSAVVAVAMTATSVGAPAAVWQREDAIDTDQGQLFVDVAELDDLSGIILMAMLFAVLPSLRGVVEGGGQPGLAELPMGIIAATGGLLLVKLAALAAGCYFFARFAEAPLVRLFERSEEQPDPLVSTAAVGGVIAGLAGMLGFSVAIGGFFAGLAFSRLREKVLGGAAFDTLYSTAVPFFFVSVSLRIEPAAVWTASGVILTLFAAAWAGKFVGTLAPAWPMLGLGGGALLAVSMVPRAEIAMVIASRAQAQGDWALPGSLYTGLVVTAFLTMLTAPVLIRVLIRRELGGGSR